ncbi:probable 39S ribosomal protein L24, mitochondrial [Macrosteles quadrilineatus]|uniref:probable 39S ribosomal protein L24, mitochondrial n=1 Tax=Macrosteles quadrilineatus TaxID=74068 RepID=UPI0023E22785|nr:probable 39S ribosomal protein L24, mitochondrial [Macrosteles quadrilineatus]
MRFTRFLCVRYSEIGELTKKLGNFPETYFKRRMEVIEYKTPRGFPQYRRRTLKRNDYYIAEHRPWTEEYRLDNQIGRPQKKLWVEPIKDWKIFKGDLVEILVGKDKGKQGNVIQVIQERNWVFVEGLNCELELVGESKTVPGVYVQREKPLLVTNEVALVDPNDMKPADIEWRYTEEGQRVRVSLRSERIIPVPVEARETLDYKEKHLYLESPKDTRDDEIQKVTFIPDLETFEMAIAREHNIQDDRVPAKVYWY